MKVDYSDWLFASDIDGTLIDLFRNMPERKEKCAGIVKLCVSKAVEILAREQGIEVVE